jgi:deoxyadenosine/deoxycytidine kinase
MIAPGIDIWDTDSAPSQANSALYVAISGNTAAGKSSLIAELERRLYSLGFPAVGISERVFHHQYLRLMFSNPREFAFPIQLSFLVERYMLLLRNLVGLRRTVILERCHFDDLLFVEEHFQAGNIAEDQRSTYDQLALVLHARIPHPDVLVLMNPTPETSLERLTQAEQRADRPKEFPSDEAKERWVRRWHAMYVDLHNQYRQRTAEDLAWAGTTLVEVDPAQDRERCADIVYTAILNRRERTK